MTSIAEGRKILKGGSFILEDHDPADIYTPEDLTDEHRMIGQTAREFIEKEVLPRDEEIESKDLALTVELLRKAATLGLLSIDIPEKYGGMGLDKISSLVAAEQMSGQASFTSSLGGHTTIGTLPIVYFGTEAQKRKYLPKLATGELLAAYALSESGSGSDALGAKTKAVLSPDGKHYLLSGQKMWITNAGFADVVIVFAKVDGEKFTAFIVERGYPGFTVAPEEHKMGLNGSSTCALNLEDVPVPVENVLGEIGKGAKIAFNILNIGRLKLGVGAVIGSKNLTSLATDYANQRHQFGVSISSFGLIKQKLAEMASRAYVGECMVYRTVGMIEAGLEPVDPENSEAVLKAIEDYAIECSIIKVAGSETLGYCADEAVQVFGGNGYSKDYPAERAYRDARINRIFEGTNEINRLIMTGFLLKRAMSGQLPLMPAIKKLMDEVLSGPLISEDMEGSLAEERKMVAQAKKLGLFAAGAATQKYMQAIQDQQEIMGAIADMTIETYAMESAVLRTQKIAETKGEPSAALAIAMTRVYLSQAMEKVESAAKKVIAAVADGDVLRTQLAILRRLSKYEPFNTIELRQQIAQKMIERGKYTLA